MAKTQQRQSHRCSECGWQSARWVGRCGECQTWGSVALLDQPRLATVAAQTPSRRAVPITEIDSQAADRVLTGIGELDRVLGGGLVPGVVALLAGEPGVGKSTLLLEVAAQWAQAGRRTLYITGEESAAQVRLRADRTRALSEDLFLAAETDLGTVLGQVEEVEPTLLVVDSVQTIGASDIEGTPGGVTQIRAVTAALVRVAKQRGIAVIIVGHVTKDGNIAGPRLLEHLVDVVLAFEGDRHSGFRLVRATKNRYGPADEVGCFEMSEDGIVEVPDPSGRFTSHHEEPVPGTCVTVTMEGRRPMLAELQALAGPSSLQLPRRTVSGVDSGRLSMVLAVIDRRVGIRIASSDIYVSTVGGAKVCDPAADLAAAAAVASSALNRSIASRCIAIGEVGLAGELRRVPGLDRRLAEASRLGFTEAVVPSGSRASDHLTMDRSGLLIRMVPTLSAALQALGLAARPTRSEIH